MMSCTRGPEPDALKAVAQRGTKNWIQRLEKAKAEKKKAPAFNWPQHQRQRVNQTIMADLRQMTASHCAYCDDFPLLSSSKETIDHFKPKSRFPEEVLRWSNLFLACDYCQELKRESFDPQMLKPDEDYDFVTYFWFDAASGRIEPNPRASAPDQERANITIRILGLNEGNRPFHRMLRFRSGSAPGPAAPLLPDEQPFRFMYL